MLRLILSMTLLSLVLLSVTHASASDPCGRLAVLLSEAGLTPETAQLSVNRWRGGGTHSLSLFDRIWDDWTLLDPAAVSTAAQLKKNAGNLHSLTHTCASLIDAKVSVNTADSRFRLSTRARLAKAIADLHVFLDAELPEAQLAKLHAELRQVPEPVAASAAVIIESVPDAIARRNHALRSADLKTSYDKALALGLHYAVDADTIALMQSIDMAGLMTGGLAVAHAVDRAVSGLKSARSGNYHFSWDTPAGEIILSGDGNINYGSEPHLLIIDTKGNDLYKKAASADHTTPVSVVIDLAGDDSYGDSTGGIISRSCLGYSFLVDFAGNDSYKADAGGLGAGIFGVSILLDRSGNDSYEIREAGQGMAAFGIGVLSDLRGNDRYYCFTRAQGYGQTHGCGALVDLDGDDTYDADDKTITYPSPQTPEHNTSLAQGCGFGRRDHPGAGNSLAGGVGVLVDAKGNDSYKAGLFAQGASYWYALGMLIDMAGRDTYHGVWYVQASSAHYAVAALCDLDGSDRYVATWAQSQGSAHDMSTGWLRDAQGDDYYQSTGPGLGSSSVNSIAIAWDQSGKDEYTFRQWSFGHTRDATPGTLALGVFLDEGGQNKFPEEGSAKQSTIWKQKTDSDQMHFAIGASK